MRKADITEKNLIRYNDVFSDICNVLIFGGRKLMHEDELEDVAPRSQYRSDDGELHEQERDISKLWRHTNVKLTLFGIENQSQPDADMPLRVIGYDGASYRSQLLSGKPERYPVVTIVLYFGKKPWRNTYLHECFTIPPELKDYVNDYKVHVFEIAKLTDAQLKMFQSDFRFVADYCVQTAKAGARYVPPNDRIQYVDELLKLFETMTGDNKFAKSFTAEDRKRGVSMVSVISSFINDGIQQGMQKGMQQEHENAVEQLSAYFLKEHPDWTLEYARETAAKILHT